MKLSKRLQSIFYTPVHKIKARSLGKEILPFIKPSTRRIIDLGCGDCALTKFIQQNIPANTKFTPVDVLDISLNEIKPLIYDGEKLPFRNDYFDLGYISNTLHHCEDEKKVLRELIRVCKKDILILEEVYGNSIEKYVTYANDWIANRLESAEINVPFNFHTDRQWKKIFEEVGCNLISQQRIYQLPLWFHTKGVLYHIRKTS